MILYIPAARANSLNRTGDLWISPLLYQLSYIGYKNSRRRSTRVRVCTGSWGLSTPLPRTGSGLRFLGSWLLYLLPDTSMQTIQEISCMKQVGMDSNHYRRFWRPQFCLWTTNPWDRQAAKILDKTKKNRDKIMQSYISTVTCRLSVLLIFQPLCRMDRGDCQPFPFVWRSSIQCQVIQERDNVCVWGRNLIQHFRIHPVRFQFFVVPFP